MLLSLLAAGPLEDVISMETIDRIEREAAADKRFHDLLGGVWYFRAPDELPGGNVIPERMTSRRLRAKSTR